MTEKKEKSGWKFLAFCSLLFIISMLIIFNGKNQPPTLQEPSSSYNYLINIKSENIVNEIRCFDEVTGDIKTFNSSLVYSMGEVSDYVSKNEEDIKITYKVTHHYFVSGEEVLNNKDFKNILSNWTYQDIKCRTEFETFNYDIYDNGYKESKKIYLYDSLDILCQKAPEKEEGWKCSYFYDYQNYETDFSNIPYLLNEKIVNYDFDGP